MTVNNQFQNFKMNNDKIYLNSSQSICQDQGWGQILFHPQE